VSPKKSRARGKKDKKKKTSLRSISPTQNKKTNPNQVEGEKGPWFRRKMQRGKRSGRDHERDSWAGVGVQKLSPALQRKEGPDKRKDRWSKENITQSRTETPPTPQQEKEVKQRAWREIGGTIDKFQIFQIWKPKAPPPGLSSGKDGWTPGKRAWQKGRGTIFRLDQENTEKKKWEEFIYGGPCGQPGRGGRGFQIKNSPSSTVGLRKRGGGGPTKRNLHPRDGPPTPLK